MKTRIKVLQMANETTQYIPQYRFWGIWFSWKTYSDSVAWFPNQEQAENYIQNQIEDEKKQTVVGKSFIRVS